MTENSNKSLILMNLINLAILLITNAPPILLPWTFMIESVIILLSSVVIMVLVTRATKQGLKEVLLINGFISLFYIFTITLLLLFFPISTKEEFQTLLLIFIVTLISQVYVVYTRLIAPFQEFIQGLNATINKNETAQLGLNYLIGALQLIITSIAEPMVRTFLLFVLIFVAALFILVSSGLNLGSFESKFLIIVLMLFKIGADLSINYVNSIFEPLYDKLRAVGTESVPKSQVEQNTTFFSESGKEPTSKIKKETKKMQITKRRKNKKIR